VVDINAIIDRAVAMKVSVQDPACNLPKVGDIVVQQALKASLFDDGSSFLVNQRPKKVIQTAVALYMQHPGAFITPKPQAPHTGSFARLVHWVKGTIPSEDVPAAIVDQAVKAGSSGISFPVTIGERVVDQAVHGDYNQQCSSVENLMGNNATEATPCQGLLPSPLKELANDDSTVQKVVYVALVIGAIVCAVHELRNLYVQPPEKKLDALDNTSAIVPMKLTVVESIIEEPQKNIVSVQEKQQIQEPNSSGIIEEVKETKQEKVASEDCALKLTPEQAEKLQRFIVLFKQSPELQMVFTCLLHRQICLQADKRGDDVENNRTYDGG
jgi:hypothetical protein